MSRVGQDHIYTVYIRYLRQGNHQIYHKYTVIHGIYIYIYSSGKTIIMSYLNLQRARDMDR